MEQIADDARLVLDSPWEYLKIKQYLDCYLTVHLCIMRRWRDFVEWPEPEKRLNWTYRLTDVVDDEHHQEPEVLQAEKSEHHPGEHVLVGEDETLHLVSDSAQNDGSLKVVC